jgi:dTDP-4-dehydrorhamnose reductase
VKILIVGGSGLVGSHMLRAATARGHEAIGTFRTVRAPQTENAAHTEAHTLVRFDAALRTEYAALLDHHRPDAVIHAAGWTWVDGCEDDPARAMEENCRQPADLAAACAARGIRFTYISTSYVFDGAPAHAQPYDETSPTGPDERLGVYALSKLAGERAVAAATSGEALITRVICVFGEDALRKNFACQVCDAMVAGKTMRLPADQRGNPTWAGDIARETITLLTQKETGVWHLGGPDPDCGRMEWADRLVAAFTRVGISPHPDFALVGVTTAALGQKAPRPLRAGIVSHRLTTPTMVTGLSDEVYRRIADGA